MPSEWIAALLGGGLIGLAATLLLYWNGRVAGISGIIGGLLTSDRENRSWRGFFVIGLLTGGGLIRWLNPSAFSSDLPTPIWSVLAAGLLVGFGTALGGGCTSGHGVCGISRLSLRSIAATGVFIAAGIASVAAFRALKVIP